VCGVATLCGGGGRVAQRGALTACIIASLFARLLLYRPCHGERYGKSF